MHNNRIYLSMVLACLFWSGAFITGKLAVQEFPPVALTFYRFLFALPFIFALLYQRQPGNWLPKKEEWPAIFLQGFLGPFLYHILFFSSLRYTTAINSSLIGATNPMVTAVLAAFFAHEKISVRRLAGILLSFCGVFLVVTGGNWEALVNSNFNTGDILMFSAVIVFSLYMHLSQKFMKKYEMSPLILTAYSFLFCVVLSLPFMLWEGPMTYLPFASVGGWLSIAYMAVFASFLGYLIQATAIQKMGPSNTAVFIYLVPVFTIIQSVLLLGEQLSWFKLASAMVIIFGVYLTTRPDSFIKMKQKSY